MSAKKAAKPKAAKVTAAKKPKKPTAGMSAAQVKAYTKAANNRRVSERAVAYRQRRLATARRVTAQAARSYQSAAQARTVAYATRRSFQQTVTGHQSAALRKAAAQRVFNATRVASSRKFVALGQARHARQNVLQTVTSAQALAIERRLSSKARATAGVKKPKTAKKASAAKTAPRKSSSGRSGYSQAAVRAGLNAAAKVPKSASASKKKAAAKPKVRKAASAFPAVNPRWVTAGNDRGTENCVAVAIANHLLAWTGVRMTDEQIKWLSDFSTISGALNELQFHQPFAPEIVLQGFYETWGTEPGMIIGYESEYGPHVGVLLVHEVVSYGEVVPLNADIEEGFYVAWMTSRAS